MECHQKPRTTPVLSQLTKERGTIVDPFCGKGTVLAVANELELDAFGIDIDESMCAEARKFEVKI